MGKALAVVLTAYLAMSAPVLAETGIPAAYLDVASYVGVPAKILYAVALRESGRTAGGKHEPWPWTLNIAGKGVYYESRLDMFNALMSSLQSGITSIDIGPMQTNWKWQFDRIISPWQITDPTYNTKIGAEILFDHYKKTGDWWVAVGKYHRGSEKPKDLQIAKEYAGRVKKTWGDL